MEQIFDEYQKLNLLNQFKILRDIASLRKNKHDEELYDNNIKILQYGFTHEYNLFEEFSTEMTSEQCELVWDILDLYCAMKHSYNTINSESIKESDIYFKGFDGNNESQILSYCEFILFNLNRFCELTENERHDFNSHHEMYNEYKIMVDKWIKMGKHYNLSEKQIIEILGL